MFRLRSLALPLILAALSTAVSHAQTSVYATAGIANYGFTHTASNGLTFNGDTGSFGGGAFYNFPIESRVTVGIDGRASFSPGDKGGYLAGAALRVGFVPQRLPLRPFFQLGGGVVHSVYDASLYTYNSVGVPTLVSTRHAVTNGAAQVIFGLDIRLTDRLDLRLPEYGAQAGPGDGIDVGVGFLHAGLVYHLRPR